MINDLDNYFNFGKTTADFAFSKANKNFYISQI